MPDKTLSGAFPRKKIRKENPRYRLIMVWCPEFISEAQGGNPGLLENLQPVPAASCWESHWLHLPTHSGLVAPGWVGGWK